MEQLKQLSIFSENKPGRLKRITKVLAEEGVNILAINIASSNGFGVLKFIVDLFTVHTLLLILLFC